MEQLLDIVVPLLESLMKIFEIIVAFCREYLQ